ARGQPGACTLRRQRGARQRFPGRLGQYLRPALQPGTARLPGQPQVRSVAGRPEHRQPDQQRLGPHLRLRLLRQQSRRNAAGHVRRQVRVQLSLRRHPVGGQRRFGRLRPGRVAVVRAAGLPLQVLIGSRRIGKRPGQPGRFRLRGRLRYSRQPDERVRMEQRTIEAATTSLPVVSARIYPRGALDILSRDEVARLKDASSGGMHDLLRRCALAVLTSGSASDDPRAAQELYPGFDIQVLQQDRGVRIELINAPAMAFVDGHIIRGVAELLFAVVRDLAWTAIELVPELDAELETSAGLTNAVFGLLRNARILQPADPNLVVCWGGHSIGREEYQYTKNVGYELGLRGLDICTGCGPGAMKGPMKGATVAHAKQRRRRTRYIGITEPGIIAAESPSPIVNHLVIMPDIEKRLEAFVRLGHGI